MKSVIGMFFVLSSILLTGCTCAKPAGIAQPAPQAVVPAPVMPVPPWTGELTVRFYGNSCFEILSPDGTRIVSDPYSDYGLTFNIDKLPRDLVANAVTISHEHTDHNGSMQVGGGPRILKDPGVYEIGAVKVSGYPGFEGSPKGPSAMPNIVFVYEIAGAKIVQLGDSGVVTDPAVLAAISDADILIVNIDMYVIDRYVIAGFLKDLRARTIVPAHFSVSNMDSIYEVDDFLKLMPQGTVVARIGTDLALKAGMPKQVVVMTPLMLRKE